MMAVAAAKCATSKLGRRAKENAALKRQLRTVNNLERRAKAVAARAKKNVHGRASKTVCALNTH